MILNRLYGTYWSTKGNNFEISSIHILHKRFIVNHNSFMLYADDKALTVIGKSWKEVG